MQVYSGTIVNVRGSRATVYVPGAREKKSTTVVLEVARCAKVTRNGLRALLSELQPGDAVEVKGIGALATDLRALRRPLD